MKKKQKNIIYFFLFVKIKEKHNTKMVARCVSFKAVKLNVFYNYELI